MALPRSSGAAAPCIASTHRSWSTPAATIVGKYRKIHLPGHAEHEPWRAFQHLEKRYFEVGDLGFGVWKTLGGNFGMCICNDRRWPETYRVMGLQNVEMVVLGYNTPRHNPPAPDHDALSDFHNRLSMQARRLRQCHLGRRRRQGRRRGGLRADRRVVHHRADRPDRGAGLTLGDELVVARCDLDLGQSYKRTTFNFASHRQPDQYRLIVERTGAEEPE